MSGKGTVAKSSSALQMWMGVGGMQSLPHFDSQENLLAQIAGQKIICLVGPLRSQAVYPYRKWGKPPNYSPVDFHSPEYARWPLFRDAGNRCLTMRPGDMLYIPSYWWHHVRSVERNVAVNFWYTPASSLVSAIWRCIEHGSC